MALASETVYGCAGSSTPSVIVPKSNVMAPFHVVNCLLACH